MDIERRAIGAQDLAVGAHVEEDVRVIERRARAHALQLPDAHEDLLGAEIICEMRGSALSHGIGGLATVFDAAEHSGAMWKFLAGNVPYPARPFSKHWRRICCVRRT